NRGVDARRRVGGRGLGGARGRGLLGRRVKERLQKVIAAAGICSRREAERLIESGEVRVNHETIRRQGVQVDLAVDRVEVLGRRIRAARAPVYVALHKPRGYVTTVK